MNIDNASSDHDRGGFAIGGQNMDKGLLDYFQVTPDSVRIYLDESVVPSDRGGFAIGGQNMDKAITGEYLFINTDSTRITTAAEGGFGIASKTVGAKGHGVNYLNITTENMFIGEDAGKNNDLGVHNSFFGTETGYNNTLGSFNVFLGQYAGHTNTEGHNNVFVGQNSGYSNLSGLANVFLGQSSGENNSNGSQNVFLGYQTGFTNNAGNHNVFIGNQAGYYEENSNKLYIENSDKNYQNALIYGDFNDDKIRLNANVGIDIDDEDYKLNVNGDLNFNGGLYQNGVPYNPGLIKAQLSDDLGSPLPYATPVEGFMIFNDGANQPHGFYYWEGNQWLRLLTSSGADILTNAVANIGLNSADLEGEIVSDGGSPVTIIGFCWDTEENPDLNDTHNAEAYSTSPFSTNISGLTAYETYFARAYAINQAGTKYGNQVSFTTSVTDNISVTSPTAGDILYAEYTYDIEWTDNIAPDVAIELWKGAGKISDIDISTESDGSHTWTLANDLVAGNDYKIKVINTGDAGLFDFSDNFEIRVPEFTIVTPIASEEWIAGQNHTITWSSNLPENFKIELWRAGAKVADVNTSIAASLGTYEYSVPANVDIYSDYGLTLL